MVCGRADETTSPKMQSMRKRKSYSDLDEADEESQRISRVKKKDTRTSTRDEDTPQMEKTQPKPKNRKKIMKHLWTPVSKIAKFEETEELEGELAQIKAEIRKLLEDGNVEDDSDVDREPPKEKAISCPDSDVGSEPPKAISRPDSDVGSEPPKEKDINRSDSDVDREPPKVKAICCPDSDVDPEPPKEKDIRRPRARYLVSRYPHIFAKRVEQLDLKRQAAKQLPLNLQSSNPTKLSSDIVTRALSDVPSLLETVKHVASSEQISRETETDTTPRLDGTLQKVRTELRKHDNCKESVFPETSKVIQNEPKESISVKEVDNSCKTKFIPNEVFLYASKETFEEKRGILPKTKFTPNQVILCRSTQIINEKDTDVSSKSKFVPVKILINASKESISSTETDLSPKTNLTPVSMIHTKKKTNTSLGIAVSLNEAKDERASGSQKSESSISNKSATERNILSRQTDSSKTTQYMLRPSTNDDEHKELKLPPKKTCNRLTSPTQLIKKETNTAFKFSGEKPKGLPFKAILPSNQNCHVLKSPKNIALKNSGMLEVLKRYKNILPKPIEPEINEETQQPKAGNSGILRNALITNSPITIDLTKNLDSSPGTSAEADLVTLSDSDEAKIKESKRKQAKIGNLQVKSSRLIFKQGQQRTMNPVKPPPGQSEDSITPKPTKIPDGFLCEVSVPLKPTKTPDGFLYESKVSPKPTRIPDSFLCEYSIPPKPTRIPDSFIHEGSVSPKPTRIPNSFLHEDSMPPKPTKVSDSFQSAGDEAHSLASQPIKSHESTANSGASSHIKKLLAAKFGVEENLFDDDPDVKILVVENKAPMQKTMTDASVQTSWNCVEEISALTATIIKLRKQVAEKDKEIQELEESLETALEVRDLMEENSK